MSAARKRKKAAKDARWVEWSRKFDKRYDRDPSFHIGQQGLGAPVKYSRCASCAGEHHSPIWKSVDDEGGDPREVTAK